MARRTASWHWADPDSLFQAEHSLAYVFAAISLIFGIIGIFRGFGVVGGNDASNTPIGNISALWDGIVWLLPAISMAFLAWAFHSSEHHRMREPDVENEVDAAAWKSEHLLAGAMAVLTVLFALLGILTGFHLLGHGDHQIDSMPWHLASITCAILTNALHSVRHHQLASDDVFVVARRDDRAAAIVPPTRPIGHDGGDTGIQTRRPARTGDPAPRR